MHSKNCIFVLAILYSLVMSKKGVERGINIVDNFLIPKDYTTDDGRLLFETLASESAIEAARRQHIAMDYVPSSYTDSRRGTMTHVSALESIVSHWTEVIEGLAWINNRHFGTQRPAVVTVEDTYDLANMGVALPDYLLNRRKNPFRPYRHLPVFVGGIFKLSQGIRAIAGMLSFQENSDAEPVENPSRIFEVADRTGLLIREDSGTSCPAPKEMITQAVRALLYPSVSSIRSPLERIVEDFDSFRMFSTHYSYMLAKTLGFANLIDDEMSRILDPKTTPEEIIAVASGYLEREKHYIAGANDVQGTMNILLGRDPGSAPQLTQRDIERMVGRKEGFTIIRAIEKQLRQDQRRQ